MIYVCIYIYNIYRYIHTRTYINMYTFTARGDNARVISRNRYIKVCSCRRTRPIASEFAGWIATSARGQSSRASSDILYINFSFSTQKSRRPIGSIPLSPPPPLSPSSERIAKLGSARRRRPAPLGRRRYFQNIARENSSRPRGTSGHVRVRITSYRGVVCIF